MSNIYEINNTRVIESDYPGFTSQFFILKKYDCILLDQQKLHPDRQPTLKNYGGVGRKCIDFYAPKKRGLSKEDKQLLNDLEDFTEDIDEFLQQEQNAVRLLEMFRQSQDYEIVWANVAGSGDKVPGGYKKLGYDVCYPLCFDETYSAILSSARHMSLSERLNRNGLFDDLKSAAEFLHEYAKQDFCDDGEYCICEIYRKDENSIEAKIINFPAR